MSSRPAFLNQPHENGQAIVAAFRLLPKNEAASVDRFLLWGSQYGSLTWQEVALFDWINEEMPDCDAA